MNEEVCPVKLDRRRKSPGKSIPRDHAFDWTPNGKDESGALLKRGICSLCGFDLGIERFCSRCRIKLPDEEPTSLCSECIEERELESAG